MHSWCAAYVSGHGQLEAEPSEVIRFEPVSVGREIAKTSYVRRSLQELRLGVDLVRHVLRRRPGVVLVANTPIPMLVMLAAALGVMRKPFVLWHQDVQAVAVARLAGTKLSPVFGVLARVLEWGERWASQRAAAVVAITPAFGAVHEKWGTADKLRVIPNWAPLDEISPRPRDNDWAVLHDLVDSRRSSTPARSASSTTPSCWWSWPPPCAPRARRSGWSWSTRVPRSRSCVRRPRDSECR